MAGRVAFKISGHPVFNKDGVPRAKGRARAYAKIVYPAFGEPKAIVTLVTPAETREAEAAIRAAFRRKFPDHKPWTGPVLLRFTAVFQTPRSFNKALKAAAAAGSLMATRKPDKDNIEKLIVDALNGIAFVDDQQVMGGGMKRYGSPPRLEISFERLDDCDVPPTPGQRRADKRQQGLLPLAPKKPRRANQTKPQSDKARQDASPKVAPDLSGWSPSQRALIEKAMARDEKAKRERRK